MNNISKRIRKKDAMQLVTGQPVYVEDITPSDCLIVKLLRSPYASAVIEEIDVSKALMVPGIEVVYTYKDLRLPDRHIRSRAHMTGLYLTGDCAKSGIR